MPVSGQKVCVRYGGCGGVVDVVGRIYNKLFETRLRLGQPEIPVRYLCDTNRQRFMNARVAFAAA